MIKLSRDSRNYSIPLGVCCYFLEKIYLFLSYCISFVEFPATGAHDIFFQNCMMDAAAFDPNAANADIFAVRLTMGDLNTPHLSSSDFF